MAVGLLQLPARRRGTHCQHTFVVWRTAPLQLDDYLRLICFLSTSVYSALGVSATMRYINRRFTYLLTCSGSIDDSSTREAGGQVDKIACFSDFFKIYLVPQTCAGETSRQILMLNGMAQKRTITHGCAFWG